MLRAKNRQLGVFFSPSFLDFRSIFKRTLKTADLVSLTFAARSRARRRRSASSWALLPSESVCTVVTVGGWARRGLMQHCTPSAVEQRGEGWVIQRRKICSPATTRLRVCLPSANFFFFKARNPKAGETLTSVGGSDLEQQPRCKISHPNSNQTTVPSRRNPLRLARLSSGNPHVRFRHCF